MDYSKLLTIFGLIFNTIAAVILIFPYLNVKKNLDDDFIVSMDKDGKHTQKKHLKERRVNMWGLTFLAIGFILQLSAYFFVPIKDNDLKINSNPQATSCSKAMKIQVEAYNEDKLSSTETFDKYRVDVYNGPLAMLNPEISSSGAKNFKTIINQELSKIDINFGGKYSIVSVGMTGWGDSYFLVDRTNGKGIIFPYRITYFNSRKDSSLLIINPKYMLVNNNDVDYPEYACSNTGGPDYYVDLRPYYYSWDGDSFHQIGNSAPVNKFWKEWKLN